MCLICEGFDFGFGFEQFSLRKKSRFQKNLASEKSLGFGFRKFDLGKKVSVSVSEKVLVLVLENLVSEKSRGFGKFGLRKKSQYWFRSKFWYCHLVVLGWKHLKRLRIFIFGNILVLDLHIWPYLAYLGAYLSAPNMVKCGVPENILQNAAQTRWF